MAASQKICTVCGKWKPTDQFSGTTAYGVVEGSDGPNMIAPIPRRYRYKRGACKECEKGKRRV